MLSLGARLPRAVELSKGCQSGHFDVGKEANRKQQSYLKLSINCVEHSPLEGARLLYILAVANALLVWTDFTFGHRAGSLALRGMFALGYAALPVVTALIWARLLTRTTTPDRPTKEPPSSFRVNLEIAWSLTLVVAALSQMGSVL